MNPPKREAIPHEKKEASFWRFVLTKLRKRRIFETIAAFFGGSWLLLEFVHWTLVDHYHLPEKIYDITLFTLIGALLGTLIWRWFRSAEGRPGNVRAEVLLLPLIILATVAVDLSLAFEIAGISGKNLPILFVAICLGIAWIVFKSLQWAVLPPESGKKESVLPKPAEARPEKSIVVLPFADMSPQKDQEYFCDGITEELITDLSHIHELRVISRNSAMTLKGTSKDTRTIGQDLNVHYVLEGSVRKAGNDLRITAQLIDAATDTHVWADKFSGTLDDVFDIQEKVSRSIVDALKLRLGPEEKRRIAERLIENVQAYECYIRAKKEFYRGSEDALERALQDINRGIAIVGENELLYAAMGSIYFQFIVLGIRAEEHFNKLKECAHKISRLNPNSDHGHYLLGLIERREGKIQESVRHQKQVLDHDPDNTESLFWLVFNYAQAGQSSAARPLLRHLLAIDPLTPVNHSLPGYLYELGGRFEDGLKYKRRYLQMDPENPFARFFCAQPLLYSEHLEEGFRLIDLISKDTPEIPWAWLGLFYKYALTNEKAKAKEIITPEKEKTARKDATYSCIMADCYSLLGEKELALGWLENAVNRGFIHYSFLSKYDPFLANVRGEVRFGKLMERVKSEWEHFEA